MRILTRTWRSRGGLLAMPCLVVTMVAGSSGAHGASHASEARAESPPTTSATATDAEPLSLTSIVFSGGFNSDLGRFWLANESGYFADLGIESAEIYSGQAGADEVLLMLSGEANFVNSGTASNLLAHDNGAPLVSVMTVNGGGTTELVLSNEAVETLGIDPDGDPLEQFRAMQGSGLTIGVPSEGGTNAIILRYLVEHNEMELGEDVTMEALGGTANMVAGFLSGQIDGFISPVPASIQPDSLRVRLNDIPPVSDSTSIALVTTQDMIDDHPDVVQAVVTGYLQAAELAKTDPATAFETARGWLERSGVEDEATQREVYESTIVGWDTPATSHEMYDALLTLTNAGLDEAEQIETPFADFVNNSFVNQAITDLGLDYPLGPEN